MPFLLVPLPFHQKKSAFFFFFLKNIVIKFLQFKKLDSYLYMKTRGHSPTDPAEPGKIKDLKR